MHKLPSLAAIRVFEAAARHGNFTRAATELGMTQAAVSYQIRVIEGQLGIALFVRDRGRIRVTPAGLEASREVSRAFASLKAAFARLLEVDERVLVISCGHMVAANWLAPRLGRFQTLRPDLDVRLDITAALVDFATTDVAIRATVQPAEHLYAQRLMPVIASPMCGPGFLKRYSICSPTDLLSVPLLSPGDVWWSEWFEAVGVAAGETVRTGMRLGSQVVEGAAALAGHGVAMLMNEMWQDDIAGGRLVPAYDHAVDTGMSLWFVCPNDRRHAPKNRAFSEWLKA